METDEEEAIFFIVSLPLRLIMCGIVYTYSSQRVKKNKQKQISWQLQVNVRGFILSRMASGLHRWAKLFDLNFLCDENFLLDDQTSQAKIVFTASQFA